MKTDKRIVNLCTGHFKEKNTILKVGHLEYQNFDSWFSENLQAVDDARKTAVIDLESPRLQMDVVALQETRLLEAGSVIEKNFTFFWQGKPLDSVREHGVGFAVRNALLGTITSSAGESERILSIEFHSSTGPVTLISAYAPTLASPAEAKDRVYDDLTTTVTQIPRRKMVFILADFNARVGSDLESWLNCLGHFGTGR